MKKTKSAIITFRCCPDGNRFCSIATRKSAAGIPKIQGNKNCPMYSAVVSLLPISRNILLANTKASMAGIDITDAIIRATLFVNAIFSRMVSISCSGFSSIIARFSLPCR